MRLPRAALVAALLFAAGAAQALPSFSEVREGHRSSETALLSREGEVLQRQRTDTSVRRGEWVALSDISPALRTALVLSEDKRFYEHSGVDWKAVSAAAWGNLWNQRTRGASTITMQLAGLLDGDWRQGPGGRSVVQKLGQTVAAQVLDRRWRKDQILEAYLNLVPFRGEIVGIDALSRTLFGKAAHGLDAREAAIAAALVRAPNALPERVGQRACGVLQALAPEDVAARDCKAMELLTASMLQRRQWAASEGMAPHLARRLLAGGQARGLASVRSTLSAPVQRFAVQSLQQQLRELQGRNVEDGAIVVLDNATGDVLAWVGSSGDLSQAAEVDGVTAMRQPGSTLKPFLYAQAIAERRLTAASLIEDSSAHIPTQNGLYIPQNYDRRFKGWVSARTALASSLNVPAVRTLVMVTPDAFFSQLQRLGLPLRESGGYHGFSLALGSAEVPLLQLTNAYRALANGGQLTPVRWTPGQARAEAPVQAIDARAAFIVGDILSDPMARAPTFGTDSVLATRFWTAVKTGTSKDMRDNWAVGWSQRYTVGVWVGNARGDAMHSVSGTSGAAPVWAAVMGFLHARTPSRAPKAPDGVLQQAVRFGPDASGLPLESARGEWFVAGTQQNLFAMAGSGLPVASSSGRGTSAASPVRIARPANGTILALDPDIPPDRQRVQLSARPAGTAAMQEWQDASLRWRMVSAAPPGAAEPAPKEIGRGAAAAWMPWPGRHRLELVDAKGQVLDSVQVEVRGAGVVASRAGGR
ncbi:Penicillin-binding protein 4 precursor [Delftia tsuruhatensis]|uniref:penicillin-binding protein 1C n=1 Tax=Delftia tsuruhatensis TaxID=180282 RepID=UPI001E792839|nr:penicillin-binding protein 1C [Delftia tsuruhatensis]CAB5696811.1 Penicillin-binding protein 4 precursor [Delftia tsuruhatensis]CAC9678558.1 Penicillin-binding protein 4 precursor [Delftia tsuruhatensis]